MTNAPTRNPNHYGARGRWAHRNSFGRFAPRPARMDQTETFYTETDKWSFEDGTPSVVVVTHHADPGCVEMSKEPVSVRMSTKSAVVKHGHFCPTCVDEGTFDEIVANVAPAMDDHICTGCGVRHEDGKYPTLTVMGYRVRGRACRKSVKSGSQQSPYVVMFDLFGRVYDGKDPMTPAMTVRDILTHFDALGRDDLGTAA